MVADPGFEAALYRSYNRYVGRQCQAAPKRLKWAGLLPMREQSEALRALDEMQKLGASAAVVFGTVGERLLSDPSFNPIWDVFAQTTLPLCVHMGMSYPPFQELCRSIQDANMIAKALPAQTGVRRHRRQQDARPVCQSKGRFPRVRRRVDLLHVRQNGALPQSQPPAHARPRPPCRKRKSRITPSPAGFLSRRNRTTRCWPRRSLSSVKIKSFFRPTFPTAREGKTPRAAFSSAAI